MSDTVIALPSTTRAFELPRDITVEDWERYRGYVGEILAALGLPPGTPGTRDTPERFLRALYDATAGYEGDPKLVTTFPAETGAAGEQPFAQIVEGPIAFSALTSAPTRAGPEPGSRTPRYRYLPSL